MSTAPKARGKRAQEVPECLIYEIVDGKPIYYKGYQEVLNGLKKLDDYLSFGTAKVIWIFTDSQKVMVATAQKPWLTYGWGENIEVLPGLFINVQQIVGRQQKGPKSGVRE